MLTKKRYSIKEKIQWTCWRISLYLVYMTIITFIYDIIGLTFLNVPWTPVALIGTAVAFIIGFQNSAGYGRIWEVHKMINDHDDIIPGQFPEKHHVQM